MMLHDAESFVRVQNIYNPENFDRSIRSAAEFLTEYSTKYQVLPDHDQIKAKTGVELKKLDTPPPDHVDWFMDEFETFSRHKALGRAIVQSADLLEDFNHNTPVLSTF